MSTLRRIRIVTTTLGIVAVAVAVVGIGVRTARGVAPLGYNMTASANTASIEVDDANFPLLAPQAAYISPGSAQAQLNSYGGSTAFAGAPFIGQTLEGVGGLVSGLGSGVLPPIPQTLPGYVATSSPSSPTASASQGPYTLNAQSGASSSSATAGIAATSQPTLLASSATASTTANTDGSLVSTAESITEPIGLGSLVQIGTVEASATISVDSNGNETQASSFDLGTITIAGIKVGLTQYGLKLAGTTLAIPSVATLNALLSSAGISLALLPGSKTATGITSEGLQITLTKTLPVEGATGVILILGQATAQLEYQSAPSSAGSTGLIGAGTTTSTAVAAEGDSASLPPSGVTGVQSGAPPEPVISPPASGPVPEGQPVSATSQVAYPRASDFDLGPDGLNLYLILLLAGLAMTATSRIAGALAVRRSRLVMARSV